MEHDLEHQAKEAGVIGEIVSLERFTVGATYSRSEIAVNGEVTPPTGPRDPHWSTGIIRFDNAALLLVTLEKEEYDYLDYFDGSLFWWQSQNQQTQDSPVIRQIASGDLTAHLFARIRRKTRGLAEPFTYCGQLSTPDLEGNRPVTALFGLLHFESRPNESLAALYEWRSGGAPQRTDDGSRHEAIASKQARGQGRQLDPKLRREIERYAMSAAIGHYESIGWSVEDTSSRFPFDLLCKQGSEHLRVEVKGTQSAGDEVILTIGEVNAARLDGVATDLYILHSIAVAKHGDAYALSGGAVKLVEDWVPEENRLFATAFSYRVV